LLIRLFFMPFTLSYVQFFLEVFVIRSNLNKFSQTFNTGFEILKGNLRPSTEEQCFLVVRVHLKNLVSDSYNRLILLQLKFTNNQVCEADYLKSLQLSICFNKFFASLIFLSVVIGRISKVVISIDLLINLSSFPIVLIFKESRSSCLEFQHYG